MKRMSILVLVVLLLVGVASLFAGGAQEDGDIVVSYNSPVQWANWGAVLEAFTEQTGIAAPSDPKNSGQTMAALEAEAQAPQADTAYFGIVFGIEAAQKGLLAPFEPDHFDEIPENLKDPEGRWLTIHQGAIAFIVNTDELGGAPVPESWEDLLDPMYAGKVGFLDPTQAAVGYSVYTAGNLAMGGTLDNWDKGVQYFKKLMDNDLALPAQTATAMVQQGEIPILIDADFNGYKLKYIDDAPVEIVIPKEGSISVPYVISLVEGAPHEEAGKALINFTLSDAGQQLFAESYIRPIRKIDINPEIAEKMLPDKHYERVNNPDFAKMREVQSSATDLWKSEVR